MTTLIRSTDILFELFLPEYREQLQFLVPFGARRCGADEERLGLIFGEEHLAVQFDRAELWVDQDLVVLETLGHLVPLPERGELSALLLQRPDQFGGLGPRPH